MRCRRLRHAFTFCSAISLVLCVAVGVMSVRSYGRGAVYHASSDRLHGWEVVEHDVVILAGRGGLGVLYDREHTGSASESQTPWRLERSHYWNGYPDFRDRTATGVTPRFQAYWPGDRPWADHYGVVMPSWTWLAVVAALPLCWMVNVVINRRQRRPGLCGACDYDLRAHGKGERCPECGTAITRADTSFRTAIRDAPCNNFGG